jgi:hypothetical protein
MNETETSSLSAPFSANEGPALADWWDGMLWHRILRAPVLGLRPGRLGLGFFFAVLLLLLLSLGLRVDAWLVPGGAALPWQKPPPAAGFAGWLWELFVALPLAWVRGWPVTTLLAGPLLVVLGAVLLGAISRISAEEFSRGRQMSWQQGLTFSARLWRSSVGAYIGPIVLVWILAGILAALGWVLMSWPVVNIVGGLLFGLFLLGALLAVVVAVAFILGEAMLIPAVVCEGADAIDAVQRAYAYVLARPVRLIIYLLLGLVAVVVVVGIVAAVAWWTIGFAAQASGALARPAGWNMVWWGSFDRPPAGMDEPGGIYAVGAALIRIWVLVPILLVIASFFSCSMAAATVVYLAMRRVCDGQDVGELWMPGAVEATMAEVMRGRAQAGPATAEGEIANLREADDR